MKGCVDSGDTARTHGAPAGRAGRRSWTAVGGEALEVREVTRGGPGWGKRGVPLREDPETWDRVSTQGSTPQVIAHPSGGQAIDTRA